MTHDEIQREYDAHISRTKENFKHALSREQLKNLIMSQMRQAPEETKKFISRIISDSMDFAFENGWAQGKAAYRS